MEILSTNYNCRNPFVAGFLPILDPKIEDNLQENLIKKKLSDKNLHILITNTNSSQSNLKIKNSVNQTSSVGSQMPTTIYQIDVSKVCLPRVYLPRQIKNSSKSLIRPNESEVGLNNTLMNAQLKSKKALRNKRQKETKRKRRNQRHVHFPEQEEMIAIIFIVEDDECIKESRNKYWEIFAIDRNRFQHRIKKLSNVLERVLMKAHREKIYKERFATDCNEEKNNDLSIDLNNSDTDKGQEIDTKINGSIKLKIRNIKRFENDESAGESGLEQTEEENESENDLNLSDSNEEKDNEDIDRINFNKSVSLRITLSETTIHHFFKPN